jgi:hypothetical protein
MPEGSADEGGIGTPDTLREHLRKFAEVGVDQVAFIQQGGRNKHEHICEALELFAREVMPEFHANEAERVARKEAELAPYIAAAFRRKQGMQPLADSEIPPVLALGRQIAEQARAQGVPLAPANAQRQQAQAQWAEALKKSGEKAGS